MPAVLPRAARDDGRPRRGVGRKRAIDVRHVAIVGERDRNDRLLSVTAAAVFDALSVGAYGRRTMRHTLAAATLLACLVVAGTAAAQRVGSLAEWKQRVLEPASIGLELYPGSAFNMKFTIDQDTGSTRARRRWRST